MGKLKQIEVNGTTYDIGVGGSDLSLICETCQTSGSTPSPEDVARILHDKHFTENGSNYTYTTIESPIVFLRELAGSEEKVIVIPYVESTES